MNLEHNQRMHDAFISNSHNISGSNDPKQVPNDAIETLLRGAQLLANGRNAGMTDEQTMDQVFNSLKRDAYLQQNAGRRYSNG